MSALKEQIGGKHYKDLAIQPAEFIFANNIGYLEGSVIYYCTRWKVKNRVEDLKKARHTLDILIELETAKNEKEKDAVIHSGARFAKGE